MSRLKTFIFYPYLFAVFPVLFLYAHNIKEVRLLQPLPALVAAPALCFLLMRLFRVPLKSNAKAGFVTVVFLLLFFTYGHIYDQFVFLARGFGIDSLSHTVMIPVFLLVWFVVFILVFRSKRDFSRSVSFLNIAALTLVLLNLFTVVRYHAASMIASETETEIRVDGEPIKRNLPPGIVLPDVYYFILDEYAGLDSVKKLYGYDNQPFIDQMRERGFYVATGSTTRYNLSEKCMASVFSMRFLEDGDEPYHLIQTGLVARLFEQWGYDIHIFPMNAQAVFRNSDEVHRYAGVWFNDFNLSLLETSMLRFWFDALVRSRDFGGTYRDRVLYIFDTLKELPREKGPKFVYAHINCPHFPFVFDREGGETAPENFFNVRDKQYYLDQYLFTNRKVLEVVDRIIKDSEVPPVIVVQSDHGQRGAAPRNRAYRMKVGLLWQDIFNAYYLPGNGNKGLYETISPVNTFRVIFNTYFGTDFSFRQDD